MNQNTHITPGRVQRSLRWRFNPLRNITPEGLVRQLDNFEAGYLGEAAASWELIEKRDDLLKAVVPKRKKAVSRQGWEVLPLATVGPEQAAEAKRHAAALEYFYRNLRCANAIDENERGGFQLLVRQMMDAVGKRYAVHEIVWRPEGGAGAEGARRVTAELRFVPLTFFENTTGRLRFLEAENQTEGTPLEEGEWMVTVADGLMVASSIAWMFKYLTLNDWANYSEKQGKPGVQGVTQAERNSADWQNMADAIGQLLAGEGIVTGANEEVRVIDLAKGGNAPFAALVDRLDRMIAALWRGADLSTLSREHGYGASLQDKEACLLEEDDAAMIAETLHRYVDEWVIRYAFGEGVKPLAAIKVLVAGRDCTDQDLRIDAFLAEHGAPVGVGEALQRYGRALPKPGEPLLRPLGSLARGAEPAGGMPNTAGETGRAAFANTADCPAEPGPVAGLRSRFEPLQGDWLQLAPLGDFPHAKGIQRVDKAGVEAMVRHFNSFMGRLGRWFAGVPFYAGHPDAPSLAREYPDKKAYGWIMELEARADGLYGKPKWSAAGRELIEGAHYKYFSPYWEAEEIRTEGGGKAFRPTRLLSVGFTNQPNLPVRPLANAEEGGGDVAFADGEGEQVGDAEALTEAEWQKIFADLYGRLEAVSKRVEELDNAARRGREEAAAGPERPMKTRAITNCLGLRKGELSRAHGRQAKVRELVEGKMRGGLSYDEAWEAVKREAPAIFALMREPGAGE